MGRSGAWVRWDAGKGELEVGWRPGASVYGEEEGEGAPAWAWRTGVAFGEEEGVTFGDSRLERV